MKDDAGSQGTAQGLADCMWASGQGAFAKVHLLRCCRRNGVLQRAEKFETIYDIRSFDSNHAKLLISSKCVISRSI